MLLPRQHFYEDQSCPAALQRGVQLLLVCQLHGVQVNGWALVSSVYAWKHVQSLAVS